MKRYLLALALGLFGLSTLPSLQAIELFSEDFETPDVSGGYNQGSTPSDWVGHTIGYRASYHGLVDKDTGIFTAASGNDQAYMFNYTANPGITTKEGVIGEIFGGVTYFVTFDVQAEQPNGERFYRFWLTALDDGGVRTGQPPQAGQTVLYSVTAGSVPNDSAFHEISISYAVPLGSPHIGKDLAVTFMDYYSGAGGENDSGVIDNVVVTSDMETDAPVIVTLSPADDATDVALDTNLAITFDETVVTNAGNLTVTNITDGISTVIPMGDAQLSLSGDTLTLNPLVDLLPGKTYAVLIDATAVRDVYITDFAGITDTNTWQFTTSATDAIDPTLLNVSPVSGSTVVDPAVNFVATFSENVVLVNGGIIVVTNITDGTATVVTLPDLTQVTASGTVVTIDLSANLDFADTYAVRFDANAVDDLVGNSFAGIADTNTWQIDVAGPPNVHNNGGADQIGIGTARLRGILNAGDSANAYFVWGTSDPGTGSTGAWDNVVSMGVFAENVQFTTTLSGLLYGQTYHYRTYATNAYGDDWSASADSFLTLPPTFGGGGGGTLTPGAELNFDTGDPDSAVDSATWNSLTADATMDMVFGADVTLVGVSSSATIIGDAYRFTGGAADITLPTWNGLYGDGVATTWEFWLKPTDTGDAGQTIVESGGSGTGYSIWYAPGTTGDGSGTVNFTIDAGSGSQIETVSAVIDNTDYHHIACVYDVDYSGSIDLMAIYVDGQMVDDNLSATTSDNAANDNDNTTIHDFCGGDGGGVGNTANSFAETAVSGAYSGDIAVFRVWSQALTPSEIEENFAVLQTTGNDPTPGADVYLNAGDDDGANATWEDAKGNWDLTLDTGNGVAYVADAGSSLPGISAAYDFPGNLPGPTGGAVGGSFETLGWANTPISIEMWFKPDSTADDGANGGQVLWETGGGSGLGIFYNDGTIECAGDVDEVISSYDVSSLASEFIQVVLTYNTSGGNNYILYVNGAQVATGDRADADFSGSDPAAVGGRGGANVGGRGNGDGDAGKETESFDGKVAIFRAYVNQILTAGEVSANYDAVAVVPVSGLAIFNDVAVNVADTNAYVTGTLDGPDSIFTVTAFYSTSDNADSTAWLADVSKGSVVAGTYSDATGLSVTGLVSGLAPGTTYYYTMRATNDATNLWASPNAMFTTQTGDAIPPAILSLSPASNATDVVLSANLVVTFDEIVVPINGGVITITNLTENTGVDITIPDAQISVSQSNLTINPAADLDENDVYAVLIDNAAVKDLFNNNFAGIASTSTWFFTMEAIPPTLASTAFVDDVGGGPINMNRVITYTVTFNEDMDAATVTSNDFSNAGTAPITFGAISETSPGVFTVEVTPTDEGDLQLQVTAGAVITDVAGNALNTASAIADNTTITINFARTVFLEDFESPTTPTAYAQGTKPNNGQWVGAVDGFKATYHGITDKAGGDFSAADPNHQGYVFRYSSNAGITSDENQIGLLTDGVTYTVTFDVVEDGGRPDADDIQYNAYLMVFNVGEGRDSMINGNGTVLTQVTGSGLTDGSFKRISFSYTADAVADAGEIGKDMAIRFRGGFDTAIIDNVLVEDDSSGDVVPPGALSFSPTDGQTSVSVGTDLEITFTEAISNGTGNIYIKRSSDNATIHTLDVNGAFVTLTNDTAIVNPPSDLAEGVGYYVQVDTNAILDLFGNAYAGIADTTSWNFTTILPLGRNLLLQGSFESPVVSGQNLSTDPDDWDRSIDGAFNSSRSGLFNEDTGTFSTPDGAQAATVSYNTAALTTLESAISQTLQPFGEYTVRFRAAKGSSLNGDFKVELLAFSVGEDREGDDTGSVLNSLSGVATASDMSEEYAFKFIPNAANPHLGKRVAIQIEGNGALVDDLSLTYTPPPTTIMTFR